MSHCAAYLNAFRQFLAWRETCRLKLVHIAPRNVGQYFDGLKCKKTAI